jgi:hypothetical protein
MDLVMQHFKRTARVLAKKRDEIEEQLKSDPLELWARRFDILHNQNSRTRTPAGVVWLTDSKDYAIFIDHRAYVEIKDLLELYYLWYYG